MWCSSRPAVALFGLAALLMLLGTAGCMVDQPNETDIPWSSPASWEGTMPLPSSYMNQYQ
jgi:hypothetical protein